MVNTESKEFLNQRNLSRGLITLEKEEGLEKVKGIMTVVISVEKKDTMQINVLKALLQSLKNVLKWKNSEKIGLW